MAGRRPRPALECARGSQGVCDAGLDHGLARVSADLPYRVRSDGRAGLAGVRRDRTSLTERAMARFNNILETVGRTPVVKVAKFSPPGVEVFVKLEAFNPLGSVKDRLALGVIEAAERSG